MNTDLMFSKASDEWSTPHSFFDVLNAEFGFVRDVAASFHNRLCPQYYGLDHSVPALRDALAVRDWTGSVYWMNPPYSKVRAFIAKAALEATKGGTVVCLIPARTDTRMWHEHVWNTDRQQPRDGVEVRFIKGRLKFGGSDNSAPFPSAVVIFRPVESGVIAERGGRVSRVSDDGGRA